MATSDSPFPQLTRRRFLEQLGAVGGSSLVMTAMTSLDLMAGQAGPRPSLTGRPKSKVVILGAGVSGLVVGYELGKLGYDYRILEARDRVGGLVWSVRRGTEHTELETGDHQTCTFDEGQYVNVGPWRIPYTHTGVLNYCREVGVPVEMFINEADASYFFYEGTGPFANKRVRLREVKADMIGYTNELLVKALDQNQLNLPFTAEDKDRFVRYLVSQGYLDANSHAYRKFAARGPNDPYEFAALLQSGYGNRIRSITASDGTAAAPIFQPVGGMDQFPKGLQRAIGPNKITFNTEVQSVHQDDQGVKIAVLDTKSNKKSEIAADFVVVCMPMTVLSGIDINLSPELMAAVKATTHSNSAKMGLQMRRRFWEEDDQIFGGHLYSNLPLGEFSYPSNDYFTKKGVLLGLYANGPVGDLLDRPVKDRIEHVLTHASKVHPQIRQEFESAYAVWWRKVKYSQGGYASGGSGARRGILSKMDNRIVIGSAVTSPASAPDWQEGAVAAGWQALKTLHERAMRA
ncbi:MAG TPA: FAD-dependent oxidoreductase [Vicinamibacterales bacterium]|jgi:monoamine oxidase|nr:FAD-dependent oxidoreductase [Vicinamibacterales bacterium]